MPRLEVRYVSATTTGLFEQSGAHYGEVWYRLGDHGVPMMSRQTTVEGVLETIYGLAGVDATRRDRRYLPRPSARSAAAAGSGRVLRPLAGAGHRRRRLSFGGGSHDRVQSTGRRRSLPALAVIVPLTAAEIKVDLQE